jgi:hypothetical protein
MEQKFSAELDMMRLWKFPIPNWFLRARTHKSEPANHHFALEANNLFIVSSFGCDGTLARGQLESVTPNAQPAEEKSGPEHAAPEAKNQDYPAQAFVSLEVGERGNRDQDVG